MPSNPDTSDAANSERPHPVFAAPTAPDLGPGPRPGILAHAELERALNAFFSEHDPSAEATGLLQSLALLWHDYLEESHTICQGIETRDGSVLHGIMHRREPDYSNAKYWFRRAGQHPAYESVASRVSRLLSIENRSEWKDELIPNQVWDPMAFVDACQRAAMVGAPENEADVALLKKIQAAELECFWEYFAGRLS